MGGSERRAGAAVVTLGGLIAGVALLFGPGGLDALVYWSGVRERARAEVPPQTESPDAVTTSEGQVGAERGRAAEASPEPTDAPRLPLGEEPLPAVPYEVQERLFRAFERAPIVLEDAPETPIETDASPEAPTAESPPIPDETQTPEDVTPPEDTGPDTGALVGEAPPSTEEVTRQLAHVAGQELARGFVEELNRQAIAASEARAAAAAETEGAPTTEGEEGAMEGILTAPGAEEAVTVGEEEVAPEPEETAEAPPAEPAETLENEQRRIATEAVTTAWALQNALVPLLASPSVPAAPPPPPGTVPSVPPVSSPAQIPPPTPLPSQAEFAPPAGGFPNTPNPSLRNATALPPGFPLPDVAPPGTLLPGAALPGTALGVPAPSPIAPGGVPLLPTLPALPATGTAVPGAATPGSLAPTPTVLPPGTPLSPMVPGGVIPQGF